MLFIMKRLQIFVNNSSKTKLLHTSHAGISKVILKFFFFFFCIPTSVAVGKKKHLKQISEIAWARDCHQSPVSC